MDDKIFFLERMSFERIFALAAELGYPVTDKRWRVAAIADHLARKRSLTRDRVIDALNCEELASAATALGVDGEGTAEAIRARILHTIAGTTVKAARKLALSSVERTIVVLPAKLVNVIDGDTIDVDAEGELHRVRLRGVDAPESGESDKAEADLDRSQLATEEMFAMGRAATEWMTKKLAGRTLFLHVERTPLGPKKYLHHHQHRLLAYVTLDSPEGEDVGEAMLREGYGLVWPRNLKTMRYSHPRNAVYVESCRSGLLAKTALWQRALNKLCPAQGHARWTLEDCAACAQITPPS